MKLESRPSGHFYTEKKRLYPSVTTILHQIPNPELDAWKAKVRNWQKISAAACKFGSEVHGEIENSLMGKPVKVKHKMQMEAFRTWREEIGFQCFKTEVKVKSVKGYAGSLDLFGKIGEKLYIIDLKTSKQIYPEMLLQLSAYKYAFLEANTLLEINIGVLRLDKKVEKVEWVPYTTKEYETGITEFLELCKKWHEDHNVKVEYNKKFVTE